MLYISKICLGNFPCHGRWIIWGLLPHSAKQLKARFYLGLTAFQKRTPSSLGYMTLRLGVRFVVLFCQLNCQVIFTFELPHVILHGVVRRAGGRERMICRGKDGGEAISVALSGTYTVSFSNTNIKKAFSTAVLDTAL